MVRWTAGLALCVTILFTLIYIEYEMKTFNITSILECYWYVCVSMTTVGFGDLATKNFFGQIVIIIISAFGFFFDTMFLSAYLEYIKFSP